MKANAPERIWIDPANDLQKLSGHIDKDSVEYTRTDAFIDKLGCWLNTNGREYYGEFDEGFLIEFNNSEEAIENFRNYMKGE